MVAPRSPPRASARSSVLANSRDTPELEPDAHGDDAGRRRQVCLWLLRGVAVDRVPHRGAQDGAEEPAEEGEAAEHGEADDHEQQQQTDGARPAGEPTPLPGADTEPMATYMASASPSTRTSTSSSSGITSSVSAVTRARRGDEGTGAVTVAHQHRVLARDVGDRLGAHGAAASDGERRKGILHARRG